ncbi:MAG: type IV pilin N-terminal domain-containing protein [Thermoplasmatales archaeon]|nr:MAG: type IV pilin N-terminal domain-containing protein [Thermoplasmatales archaeon]
MNHRKTNKGVTAIVGTAVLLGIAIILFTVLNFIVLSFQSQPSVPSVNLVGAFEGDTIVIEHNGGESLPPDTVVILIIDNEDPRNWTIDTLLNDTNNNGLWNIGERLIIESVDYIVDISDRQVAITVVDAESNYVIMTGVIHRRDAI